MKRIIGFWLFFACLAVVWAVVTPRQDIEYDVQLDMKGKTVKFMQGSSQQLVFRFLENTAVKNISGGTNVVFAYAPADRSWLVTVTGTLYNATNGQAEVTFSPTQLNTNTVNTEMNWRLSIANSTETLAYAYGSLIIIEDIMSTASGILPLTTNVNWAVVGSFQNTDSKGPVRADGSTITSVTNADGSITLSATGGGGGATNHAELINLDYASAGHTGFQPTIAGTVATNGANVSVFANDAGYLTSETDDQTLAEVLTAGNVSDGYDILLSAAGLDQSRRLGFIVNSGIPPMSTNYLDSITNGVLRFNGQAVAAQSWVTGLGYITGLSADQVTGFTAAVSTNALVAGALQKSGGTMRLSSPFRIDAEVPYSPYLLEVSQSPRLVTLGADFNMSGFIITNITDLYATTLHGDGSQLTGVITSVPTFFTFTDGTTMSNGVYLGTNSIVFSKGGTNAFLRLPW